jgi:hypothetical protein|tara:strand:+ start:58 stop:951 length:894 start_codon:yes stop_codon:yes gene_type:complete
MAIDKKINFEVQGGVKNYLGKQKEVKAPVKWKSSPDHPETELAYITKAEKDLLVKSDLHGSLKGGVNRGPSGIMSLNGYGSFDGPDPGKDTGMSGTATSAAETASTSASDIKDVQAQMGTGNLGPGVMPQQAQDYQLAAIAAGAGQKVNPGFFDSQNTVSPLMLAAAKAYNPSAFKDVRGSGIMNFFTSGGILGNLIKGVGQKLGYGKKFNEPTYDMSGIDTRVYENIPGVSTNPDYYNNLDNEFINEVEAVKPVQTLFDSSGMNTELPAGQGGATIAELEAMIANAVNNKATQDLD